MHFSQIIYIIINYLFYYNKNLPYWFTRHAIKDKSLTCEDIDCIEQVIRHGRVHRKNIVKRYFKHRGCTYFVVIRQLRDSIKIITVYKKKGRW